MSIAKRRFFFLVSICVFGLPLLPRSALGLQTTADLTVVISKLRTNAGLVNVGLYNTKEGYLSRGTIDPFRKAKIAVDDYTAEYTFKQIPFGEYTIKYFHDENENGKIDFNFLRLPVEPYGFSNNAHGALGLPQYNRAKFIIESGQNTMQLFVN